MMKKFVCLLLVLMLAAALLPAAAADSAPLRIVAAVFPVWDWTRQIIGGAENVELSLLLDNGVDLHSFQPSAADLMAITSCDVFLFVGGESDDWVKDALRQFAPPDLLVLNLMDLLGEDVREETLIEGMEPEKDDPDAAEPENDEHIWLSLRNAKKLTRSIAEALSGRDPANADRYRSNAERYGSELDLLDQEYSSVTASASFHTLLFGDRFPFRYLADDYHLTCYAAFAGCSAETEASFRTIAFLAQKIDELHLPAVLILEGSSPKIAETVIGATAEKNQKLLILNSMQSVTRQDIDRGDTYLSLMKENLAVLTEALQ